MMLTNVGFQGKLYLTLMTMSFLSVNSRFIYAYTAKAGLAKENIEMLRDFTKKWIAAIIAANK